MITWTIGAGGLFGGAISRRSAQSFVGSPTDWADGAQASRTLTADYRRFRAEAGSRPWAIMWAAGAATVASPRDVAMGELTALTSVLQDVRAGAPEGPGAFFLTSSAGGVYAGSRGTPFGQDTVAVPVSAYGEVKLAQEAAAGRLLAGVCPVVIGRVANLYGPGQNLAKLQGLVSRLALAAVTQQPLNVFVSLDTLRDYIYVDDAARIAKHWIGDAIQRQPTAPDLRIIASGESVTVGQLIRTTRLVTKRPIPIALGSHPSAKDQVLDLRLLPTVSQTWTVGPLTPLPVGVKRVYLDILDRLQRPVPARRGA